MASSSSAHNNNSSNNDDNDDDDDGKQQQQSQPQQQQQEEEEVIEYSKVIQALTKCGISTEMRMIISRHLSAHRVSSSSATTVVAVEPPPGRRGQRPTTPPRAPSDDQDPPPNVERVFSSESKVSMRSYQSASVSVDDDAPASSMESGSAPHAPSSAPPMLMGASRFALAMGDLGLLIRPSPSMSKQSSSSSVCSATPSGSSESRSGSGGGGGGGSGGVVMYASPSCRHWLGYEPDEMEGNSYLRFIHEHDRPILKAIIDNEAQHGFSSVIRLRFRKSTRLGAGHVGMEVRVSPLVQFGGGGGNAVEVALVGRDASTTVAMPQHQQLARDTYMNGGGGGGGVGNRGGGGGSNMGHGTPVFAHEQGRGERLPSVSLTKIYQEAIQNWKRSQKSLTTPRPRGSSEATQPASPNRLMPKSAPSSPTHARVALSMLALRRAHGSPPLTPDSVTSPAPLVDDSPVLIIDHDDGSQELLLQHQQQQQQQQQQKQKQHGISSAPTSPLKHDTGDAAEETRPHGQRRRRSLTEIRRLAGTRPNSLFPPPPTTTTATTSTSTSASSPNAASSNNSDTSPRSSSGSGGKRDRLAELTQHLTVRVPDDGGGTEGSGVSMPIVVSDASSTGGADGNNTTTTNDDDDDEEVVSPTPSSYGIGLSLPSPQPTGERKWGLAQLSGGGGNGGGGGGGGGSSTSSVTSPRAPFTPDSSPAQGPIISVIADGALLNTKPRYDPEKVIALPRGGTIVRTEHNGSIQFGMPPETIKDQMNMGLAVATNYVMPKILFDRERGINVGEFEFPAYFNFFVLRKKINLVTNEDIAARVRAVVQQTLLGPEDIRNEAEFILDEYKRRPDLNRECGWFSKHPYKPDEMMTLDTLMSFTLFDDGGMAYVTDTLRVEDHGDEFVLCEDDIEIFRTSVSIELPLIENNRQRMTMSSGVAQHMSSPRLLPRSSDIQLNQFEPPMFGVTFLGASHGFDPQGTTTGFVLWINRRGVMVDPPPNSGAILSLYGISSILIDCVVLTHCHADHDAGTFHKILEDRRVSVVTTPTIMRSFLIKYSAISGIETTMLERLFVFHPVRIGEPMNVLGGIMKFFYSLHAIPCMGFECYFGDESLVYSADTMNVPKDINIMHGEGCMSELRRLQLLNFPFHHSLVLHEAGVPPIHTPLSTFDTLSADEKSRLYLVHVAEKDVPPNAGLKTAKEGINYSLIVPLQAKPAFADAINVLYLVSHLDFLSTLTVSESAKLLQCCTVEKFAPDTLLYDFDDTSDNFTLYVIIEGVMEETEKSGNVNYLTTGDYFGYQALLSEETFTPSEELRRPHHGTVVVDADGVGGESIGRTSGSASGRPAFVRAKSTPTNASRFNNPFRNTESDDTTAATAADVHTAHPDLPSAPSRKKHGSRDGGSDDGGGDGSSGGRYHGGGGGGKKSGARRVWRRKEPPVKAKSLRVIDALAAHEAATAAAAAASVAQETVMLSPTSDSDSEWEHGNYFSGKYDGGLCDTSVDMRKMFLWHARDKSVQKSDSRVRALNNCVCVRFQRYATGRLLMATDAAKKLRRMHRLRDFSQTAKSEGGALLMDENSVFRNMTPSQKIILRQYMVRKRLKKGARILHMNRPASVALFVASGVVEVHIDSKFNESHRPDLTNLHSYHQQCFGRGVFLADVKSIIDNDRIKQARKARNDDLLHSHHHHHHKRGRSKSGDDGPGESGASKLGGGVGGGSGARLGTSVMSATMKEAGDVYLIKAHHLVHFFHEYPGVMISFLNTLYRV